MLAAEGGAKYVTWLYLCGPGDHEYVAIYGIRPTISMPNIW